MKKYSYILVFLTTVLILFCSFSINPFVTKQEDTKKAKAIDQKKAKLDSIKKEKLALELPSDSVIAYKGKFKPFKTKAHASYYHDKFHGRRTASGRKYDKTKLTAAHKKLPFGTIVKVTNEKNGKSVIVEITDRGPFVKGREIDLSKKAFFTIASSSGAGYINVSMEVLQK
jgi:rare lipoprotein A